MKQLIVASIGVFLLVLCSITISFGIETKFFVDRTISDFEDGQFTGLALDQFGHISLSSSVEELQEGVVMLVWDLLKMTDGTIYAGTGNQGRIYEIESDHSVSLFLETQSLSVSCLAMDNEQHILAGTTAPGKLLRIQQDKSVEVVLEDFGSTYIWDIAVDDTGTIYLACGNPAKIIRITPQGEATDLFESPDENHFMALLHQNGWLYFGSEGQGVVYRIRTTGENLQVLYDTYEDEIVAMIMEPETNQVIIATGTRHRKIPTNEFDYTDSFVRMGSEIGITRLTSEHRTKGMNKNSVYRIHPEDKTVEKILTVDQTYFTCLTYDNNQNLYVGSGDAGVVYQLDEHDIPSRFLTLNQKQVVSILQEDDEHFIMGTGNTGSLNRVSIVPSTEGTYISEVKDASQVATWGRIQWDGTDPQASLITLQTRSGDTATVDETWTEWSEPYTDPSGTPITNEPHRYIQYKATFSASHSDTQAELRGVLIPYLLENRPPVLSNFNFDVIPPGLKKNDTRYTQIKLEWKAEDPDGDTLTYDLFIREMDQDFWLPLVDRLTDDSYTFQADRYGDGMYQFRLLASDAASNAYGTDNQQELTSEPCVVDTLPPVFTDISLELQNGVYILTGTVEDSTSIVRKVEVSINGNAWMMLTPVALLYDAPQAHFEVQFDSIQPDFLLEGKNVMTVRATDGSLNVVLERLYFDRIE